jgi:hypothetical protein
MSEPAEYNFLWFFVFLTAFQRDIGELSKPQVHTAFDGEN